PASRCGGGRPSGRLAPRRSLGHGEASTGSPRARQARLVSIDSRGGTIATRAYLRGVRAAATHSTHFSVGGGAHSLRRRIFGLTIAHQKSNRKIAGRKEAPARSWRTSGPRTTATDGNGHSIGS